MEDFGEDFRAATAKDLVHHIKSYIGVSVKANVVPVNEVERSLGKAKRIVDKR